MFVAVDFVGNRISNSFSYFWLTESFPLNAGQSKITLFLRAVNDFMNVATGQINLKLYAVRAINWKIAAFLFRYLPMRFLCAIVKQKHFRLSTHYTWDNPDYTITIRYFFALAHVNTTEQAAEICSQACCRRRPGWKYDAVHCLNLSSTACA